MMEPIPQVKITSQIYHQRFRYGKENRGTKKHREEDFMEVTLKNIPEGSVMKVFCVKAADGQCPHPNSVDGHNCYQGVYCHPPLRRHCIEETLKIPWLQINRTKKGDMATALEERLAVLPPTYRVGYQALMESLRQRVKEDTNQVYLCVHVSWANHPGVFDVSRLIKNEDKCSKFRIDELSHSSVPVDGGRILILTAEDSPAIEPEEIQVKIEEVDADEGITWTSETFMPGKEDIRYKHVIAYHVPRYKDRHILEPVRVTLVIRCNQTNAEDRKEILYTPLPDFVAMNRGKRKPSVAEKYGHKVLKLTEQQCVKESLRNKIKFGGHPDIHCQPQPSLPPSTANIRSVEHRLFENHMKVPHTDDNGLATSNDLLLDELPDYHTPQQAPVSQKEAGLDQTSHLMETDLIQTQEVKHLVRVSLSRDTDGGSRQFVAICDESSCSSTDMQNHSLPQSVVDLAATPDSVPDGGLSTMALTPCNKPTMMRCMQNQQHIQTGDSHSAKMEHMTSTAATTEGNPGFHVEHMTSTAATTEGNPSFHVEHMTSIATTEGNPGFHAEHMTSIAATTEGNPGFHVQILEQNGMELSPGNFGFRQPGQGGMESSQGISGFEVQNDDPALTNSDGNPEQNAVLESPPILHDGDDLMALPTINLENIVLRADIFQEIFQPSVEPDQTS
ncbi:uncharacterized protein [Haliotis asinina]|uniref:uncharacterized protein n=1 Tax=Haliotis asinina TaxID=109174 RepID=UPI003531B0F0